jgi:redox-sensitive bicupin YhaK (pirin superfamily)
MLIEGRQRDIDGFPLVRVLPSPRRRLVGPFIFFDHIGPTEVPRGQGLDVRPHPHINLATVTYLFEGEFTHRDSLGFEQVIRPGAINWMTAGRGIVHSERTPPALRQTGSRLHGLQIWVALPREHEEVEPDFHHYDAEMFPTFELDGAALRLLAGTAFGQTSPVRTLSPLFYVEATLRAGAHLPLPRDHRERAAYVVEGAVSFSGERAHRSQMLVFDEGDEPVLLAEEPSRVMLFGGAPLDGERHIFWNFVSSSQARIERAKRDWLEGRFPRVPGDDQEFIPLPDDS